jgi:TyrR family helix-turn-helix protein
MVIGDFGFLSQGGKSLAGPQEDEYPPVNLKHAVEEFEKNMIQKHLAKYGSLRKAARSLGASQTTIWRKASQYGIKLEDKPSG